MSRYVFWGGGIAAAKRGHNFFVKRRWDCLKKKKKTDGLRGSPPDQALMEIKNVKSVDPATGAQELTDYAVKKGKDWTEFNRS